MFLFLTTFGIKTRLKKFLNVTKKKSIMLKSIIVRLAHASRYINSYYVLNFTIVFTCEFSKSYGLDLNV